MRKVHQFNIAEAKAHFPELVQRALKGEEVVIARDYKPLLRRVRTKRTPQTVSPDRAWAKPSSGAAAFHRLPVGQAKPRKLPAVNSERAFSDYGIKRIR